MTREVMNNLNKISEKANDITKQVEEMMNKFSSELEKNNSEVVGHEIKEEKGKRNYVRTKKGNNKRIYAEAIEEVMTDEGIVTRLNTTDKVIGGKLNCNYMKGMLIENRGVQSGETYIGRVIGCYFGSEGEGSINEPKFSVYKVDLALNIKKPTTNWRLKNCDSLVRGVEIDKDSEITIY